jgi:PAS domain S-box-containing protein
MQKLFSQEIRCDCGKLLLKGMIFDGTLEIKCKRCNRIRELSKNNYIIDNEHYLMLIDDKGSIVNISTSGCDILGYTNDEIVGKLFTQVDPTMPKEIGIKFLESESMLNEESNFQIDTIHLTKDKKKLPVTAFIKLYIPDNNRRYLLLYVELKDTTINKDAKTQDIPKFIENVCDFYFDIDKNGIGQYMSPSVETIFGFRPQDIVGKNYFDYLPISTRENTLNTFKHFCANMQPFRITHERGMDAFGKATYTQLFFTPKLSNSGRFTGYKVLGWLETEPKLSTTKMKNTKTKKPAS